MTRVVCLPAVLAALATWSCAPRVIKLPSGAGTPIAAADAEAALEQATASCRAINSLTAEISVSGSAGGQRLRGRMTAGVAAPASARLEAAAPFGAPFFIFVATGDDATLVLPREGRVLEHGKPDAVLDAVTGVPLDAGDLERVLTGCVAPEPRGVRGVLLGTGWQRISGAAGEEAYLRRDRPSGPWRLAAALHRNWRVDYVDERGALQRTIRLTSVDSGGKGGSSFNLQLVLSQVETNVSLDAGVFRVKIPSDATPISLDELRHARSGVRED